MADLHPVHPAAAAGTCSPIADLGAYRSVIFQMLNDPDGFWLAAADRLDWDTAPRTAKDADPSSSPAHAVVALERSCRSSCALR